jgi:hypothetical protein
MVQPDWQGAAVVTDTTNFMYTLTLNATGNRTICASTHAPHAHTHTR